jgi:glycyl-tRNA synthetase beta chain
MSELLLELFSEEIPARMQGKAAEDLKRLVTEKLKEAGLAHTKADAYVTPRRLALIVDGLPDKQPDVSEDKKGPRIGSPDQAIQGFLKAAGLGSLDQCEKRTVGNAEFWFAKIEKKGVATIDVLPDLLTRAIAAMPWAKAMRWAGNRAAWVRPLHSIVALFAGRVVKGALPLEPESVAFGDTTRGHRFIKPGEIRVLNAEGYRSEIKKHYVILDQAERKEMIRRDAEMQAALEHLLVKDDPGLLDEVTGLVEFPVVLIGAIDPSYMDLPPEVLTASMRNHQKYFSLTDTEGKLAPRFIVVANMLADDGGRQIVAGNERVLRARLSDAKFFWDQDRKVKLEERVPALAARTFYAKLGTMGEKVTRLQTLAAELCEFIPGADRDRARSAALLAKADLSSGMVGEFPELQGVMGRYYALAEGETADVADAIREHYSPLGPNDKCPTAPISIAVSLADKLDTLIGFFAINEKPTGSKDPFALRRAALGIIRLIVENKLRAPLNGAVAKSLAAYGPNLKTDFDAAKIGQDLVAFFADRLKVALKEQGVRYDLIDAVFALGGEDDLVRLLARVDALKAFLGTDDGANLLVAYRRASNIVAIEEKKDKAKYDGRVDESRLKEPEEAKLHKVLAEVQKDTKILLEREEFQGAMLALALLRGPVDAFFDKVTVNSDDKELRANRLRLLSEIRRTLGQVAEFGKIEG